MNRATIFLLAGALAACSPSSTPTAPTAPAPPSTATTPVTPTPTTPAAPVTPAPNPLLSDPRFSLAFYRQLALGTLEYSLQPLRRQTQAPRIYLRTIDDAGAAIDPFTLDQTAAALINTTGSLTGSFGVAGLEQGRDTREGQAGWITVRWSNVDSGYCGYGLYGGDRLTLYPKTPGCRCAGGPAVRLRVVKHELGHVLGFYHTDSPNDLMYSVSLTCDLDPSEREAFHARVAYSQAIGSLEPR